MTKYGLFRNIHKQWTKNSKTYHKSVILRVRNSLKQVWAINSFWLADHPFLKQINVSCQTTTNIFMNNSTLIYVIIIGQQPKIWTIPVDVQLSGTKCGMTR